jgi:antitoxin YefM
VNALTKEYSYTEARDCLARLIDETLAERAPVVIKRRGCEKVALVPADELSALLETAYLLRSPANARRLIESLARTRKGRGRAMTVEKLRSRLGL